MAIGERLKRVGEREIQVLEAVQELDNAHRAKIYNEKNIGSRASVGKSLQNLDANGLVERERKTIPEKSSEGKIVTLTEDGIQKLEEQ